MQVLIYGKKKFKDGLLGLANYLKIENPTRQTVFYALLRSKKLWKIKHMQDIFAYDIIQLYKRRNKEAKILKRELTEAVYKNIKFFYT